MKLLLITAVREFEKEIKLILKKAQVKSFSYKDVKGFKDNSEDALEANWFAANEQEMQTPKDHVAYTYQTVDDVDLQLHVFPAKSEAKTAPTKEVKAAK